VKSEAHLYFEAFYGPTEVVPCYKATTLYHFYTIAGASMIFIHVKWANLGRFVSCECRGDEKSSPATRGIVLANRGIFKHYKDIHVPATLAGGSLLPRCLRQ